jgi:hypothetical protein
MGRAGHSVRFGVDREPRSELKALQRTLSPEESLLIGRALEGGWRKDPPPLTIEPRELALLAPVLVSAGMASLAWWRVSKTSALASLPAAATLHDSARLLVIEDALRESSLCQITEILNSVDITPMVFKGWAAARHYSQSWLRPNGDFDLLVHPSQYESAREVLLRHSLPGRTRAAQGSFFVDCEPSTRSHVVDLHANIRPSFVAVEALFSRAKPALLPGGHSLSTPSPEDHLRIVILHLFKHGAWRPLWLCDIAAMVETVGKDFDWELCLTSDVVARSWIEAGIAAAHVLLGCGVSHLPASIKTEAPLWLIRTILKEWRAPYGNRFLPPRAAALHAPGAWLTAHWPNPARGAFEFGAQASHGAHLPRQIACFLAHDIRYALANVFSPEWWRVYSAHNAHRHHSPDS